MVPTVVTPAGTSPTPTADPNEAVAVVTAGAELINVAGAVVMVLKAR
jgi:hypothetical protein